MKHNFEKFCKDYENIENYEKAKADNFKGWCCHHRKGVDIPTEKLKALDMYYNRQAEELVFIKLSEHASLHQKGKPKTEEHRKKLSETKKGENNPAYGKQYRLGKHHSEETKNKIAESHKGKPGPNKGKKFSEDTRKKMREAHKGNTTTKGKRWYNNGKINTMSKECPQGFVPGRIKKP